MSFKKNIVIFLLSACIVPSCRKKISCNDAEIFLGFVNVASSDIDTVVLKKYSANSNFRNPLDSIEIIPNTNAEIIIRPTGDTAVLRLFDQELGIKVGFDWQVDIPKIGKSYTISNIQQTDNEIKCGTFNTDCFCNDIVTAISLNNQNAIPNSFQSSTIFLK